MIAAERVASGQVLRLRMARDVVVLQRYFTAAYWVDGLLIDTGCAHTAHSFVSALGDTPVEQIVNTHSHEDHIGANALVAGRTDCPIFAHPLALPILENPRLQPLQPYRRIYWGHPKPSAGRPIGESVRTKNYLFEVIATPGHSPDHVCLFEPEQGWLFTGDAYVGGEDRALRAGYDIHSIIQSLKRLAQLPVTTIFSGSGSVRGDAQQTLKAKIGYLEGLGERILDLRNRGLSIPEIRREMFGREQRIAYITLGHFSGMHLVRSYLAAERQPGTDSRPLPAAPGHR